MRRTIVLAVGLLAAAVAALAAHAAATPSWSGIVVAKDASRKAVVVALPGGAVRTVRSTAPLDRLGVGARVSTKSTRLADGTFRASSLTRTGKATKARLRAVVVRVDRAQARLVLSAGGSVFAVGRKARVTTRTTRTTQSSGGPEVGDRVEISISITSGSVQATAVQTVGQATTIELEGIVTANVAPAAGAPGKLTLAVVHRGLVEVVVPPTVAAPAFAPGDLVELAVTVDDKGVFTFVAGSTDDGAGLGRGDDDDEDTHEDEDEEHEEDDDRAGGIEVKGTLTSLSPATVQPAIGAAVACAVPAGVTIPAGLVNRAVEMRCMQGATGLTLQRLATLGSTVSGHDDEDEHEDDD